jgi:scyllo-inositol 2-dehydrogenase (NADP+)
MSKSINVGLVGYGMAGEFFHAPLIHFTSGLVLHTVVERHQERAKERYPHVRVVRSLEALLADDSIDLVVIATPNNTHFDYAQKALLVGKHVVVDKPFTVTAHEGETLIALAKQTGKLLTVYQNRRLDGDFLTVKKLLAEGTLGEVKTYKAHYDRFRPVPRDSWKEEAGVFYDLGPHLIDQALALFGKPLSVKVLVQTQREKALAEDYFEVTLQYAHTQVFVSAGMLYEEPRPRFELIGSAGTFIKYGLDPQENALKAGELPVNDTWGAEAEENWGTLSTAEGQTKVETEKGNYPAYYENVYQAIVRGEKLLVDPQDALEAIRIIEDGRKLV